MQMKNLGGLDVIEVGEGEHCVVMFHGYGAHAEDLAPLAHMSPVQNVRWIFPNGCLAGPGGFGRAWFPIDPNRVLHVQESAQKWYSERPAGLDSARDAALHLLSVLNHPLEKVVLGGFSQGAMLACDLSFMLPPLCGLLALSGTLLDQEAWLVSASSRKGRYWQSHGLHDEVLPYQGGERLNQLLSQAGWQGEMKSFAGGHEIPQQQVYQFFDKLKDWFG